MKADGSNKARMEEWDICSPESEGLHHCVKPGIQDCKVANIMRLNLAKGSKHVLRSGDLEMNAALIKGSARISSGDFDEVMNKLDSFYIPGRHEVEIEALEPVVFYIGAAVCEGYGKPFFRKYDENLTIGEIHQIHGHGVGQREVYFTLNPEVESSRLLCGYTWGQEGAWTSWPPHQHEKDLEEVYCYFDMDEPKFGLHLSYLESGEVQDVVAHAVRSGSMILAPRGYHPTVSSPGTKNIYFWVLVSFSKASRGYDLAILDPKYKDT